jgi:hypothetical protein
MMVEVAVSYLRSLLKVQDLAQYIEECPNSRQDIVDQKTRECGPYLSYLLSSMHMDLMEEAKTLTTRSLLHVLTRINTPFGIIDE